MKNKQEKAPIYLTRRGKSKWKEIVAQLGELDNSEYDSLGLLCSSWDVYLTALTDVREKGTVSTSTVNGRVFVNPNVNVMNEAWKQIVKLSRLFGLEPKNRSTTIELRDMEMEKLIGDEE